MRRNLSYRVFLSKNLKEKILELIEKFPPEINNFKKDKLLYILSLIQEIPARKKRGGLSNKGFTIISSTILKKFVYNYRLYFDYLLLHGFIVCDDHYIPGEKSKGYKIAPKFISKVKPAYIQNPELIKKIRKYNRENIYKQKKYKYLRKWMDGLEIDFNGALNYINEMYAMRIRHPETRDWDFKNERFKDPIEQYNASFINIHYLKDKRFSFKVDDNIRRLHTNLTNINKYLRNFITWKGHKLVNIDISNSQPFLSSILFRPQFYQKQVGDSAEKISLFSFLGEEEVSSLSSSLGSLFPFLSSYPSSSHPRPLLMLLKQPQNADVKDIKLFLDLVEKGQLYEYLEEAFRKELGAKFENRKSIKVAVFQVLFTNNRFIGQKDAAPKRLFKELFPDVYNLFAAFKKKDATFLPCLLQKIEAKLILDIITKRISKEKPKIPIFTIHDSVTTTVEHLEYVEQVMKEELTKQIGISPKFKIEYWNSSNMLATSMQRKQA